MLESDEQWLSLTDAFYSASIDGNWYGALEGLAAATDSRCGELIVIGSNAAVPVNIFTDIDPAFHEEFVAAGGGDPAVNPRVNAGMNAPALKVLAEEDFITREEYRRHPHYQEIARPWDIPYICLATLERREDLLIGLAVARSEKQGHIDDTGKRVFASVAPHVRAAVRMQMLLEDQGAQLVVGALEALTISAFVCDSAGHVQAMTPAAEKLVSAGRGLQLRAGYLHAALPEATRLLNDTIDSAARSRRVPGLPRLRSLAIHDDQQQPLAVSVVALPKTHWTFAFEPRVLVIVHGEQQDVERRTLILRNAYALTAAEADVAVQVAAGRSAEAIADTRNVAISTVRAQIKSLLAKLNLNRQVELAAYINRL